MTTKKSVIAKEKSGKAFENLSELKIEKQRLKDLAKLLNDKIEIIKNQKDELGNQQAFIEHQNSQLKAFTSTIDSLKKNVEEFNNHVKFLTKLNDDLKSILKQTIDKLI